MAMTIISSIISGIISLIISWIFYYFPSKRRTKKIVHVYKNEIENLNDVIPFDKKGGIGQSISAFEFGITTLYSIYDNVLFDSYWQQKYFIGHLRSSLEELKDTIQPIYKEMRDYSFDHRGSGKALEYSMKLKRYHECMKFFEN